LLTRRALSIDNKEKIIHSVTATSANVHDSRAIEAIWHGDEIRVWGDSAYQGQCEAILKAAPQAQDFTPHRGNHALALSLEKVAKNRTKPRARMANLYTKRRTLTRCAMV
jgi:transposase, IS5 family